MGDNARGPMVTDQIDDSLTQASHQAAEIFRTLFRALLLPAQIATTLIRMALLIMQMSTGILVVPIVAVQAATNLLQHLVTIADSYLSPAAGDRKSQRGVPARSTPDSWSLQQGEEMPQSRETPQRRDDYRRDAPLGEAAPGAVQRPRPVKSMASGYESAQPAKISLSPVAKLR